MDLGYFDAKRKLKELYGLGQKAIKRKDGRAINYALSMLNELEEDLKDRYQLDTFGRHILNKDIKAIRLYLEQQRGKR